MSLKFDRLIKEKNNLFIDAEIKDIEKNTQQTKDAFSEKWSKYKNEDENDSELKKQRQFNWFLNLYGFINESEISNYIEKLDIKNIVDAGCGMGYKINWINKFSHHSESYGIDISNSIYSAADRYVGNEKIKFIQADIASLPIRENTVDLVICDQVLHHTIDPLKTLKEFGRVLKKNGKLFTYVYRKKALPRELFDEHFRSNVHNLTNDQIWEVSKGMTEIGKLISQLNIELDFPEIKALGIKGGKQNLQRFLYWNFFKCFWNEDLGYETSLSCNFDWYSPSIAFRYSKEEFLEMISLAGFSLEFFHEEEACFSGRFIRK